MKFTDQTIPEAVRDSRLPTAAAGCALLIASVVLGFRVDWKIGVALILFHFATSLGESLRH